MWTLSRAIVFAVLTVICAAAPARAAVTYVKPNFALVNEWSPATDSARVSAATAHSAAMQAYSTALEANPRMKPCVYC